MMCALNVVAHSSRLACVCIYIQKKIKYKKKCVHIYIIYIHLKISYQVLITKKAAVTVAH